MLLRMSDEQIAAARGEVETPELDAMAEAFKEVDRAIKSAIEDAKDVPFVAAPHTEWATPAEMAAFAALDSSPVDPLDVKYDGVTLRDLLKADELNRCELKIIQI